MDDDKLRTLEESLAKERLLVKKLQAELQQKSMDLDYKTEELESTRHNLSSIVNEKEIELNNLFKSIIDPYILMDLYGNVMKMNQASIDFFGFDNTKESFNVTSTLHPEDVPYAMKSFYQFIEKGFFRNFQIRVYDRQKNLKWVDINCNIIYDEKGVPTLAQGIVRDITSQKLQQRLFNKQKNQLDAIIEHSPIGIVLTENRKIIKSNKAIQTLLEYSEDELLGLKVGDISFKDDTDESYRLMELLDKGETENFTMNKRYRSKNGKTIWAKTNVSAVNTSDSNTNYRVALIDDVTEEQQNQSLLIGLNSLMSSILGKTNIYEIAWEITSNTAELLGFEDCVIYLLDYKTGKLQQIAAYGNKVLKKNIVKNQLEITIGDGIVGHVAETGISEIINDTTQDQRYIIDDKARLSEITVPIIANNEIIGVIDSEHSSKNYFTDYHLKTLETIANLAATQLKNALNLQLRIEADRKNKILLKNLTQSNKELKDFAHVVSHDLKSPLRSMNALVSWIQEENSNAPNQIIDDNIILLLDKIDKMDHLINGILKYASIEQVNAIKRKINLHQLVKDLIATIYIPDHVTIHLIDTLPELHVDKFRLHQLFQNLISNAIKYSDPEKGVVKIRCREKKNHWKFSIEDNGIGIAQKYHEKIFEIFQTLENKDGSTGIGLSIVKKIVDMYNGKIWLVSSLNKGTTFFFTIPKD